MIRTFNTSRFLILTLICFSQIVWAGPQLPLLTLQPEYVGEEIGKSEKFGPKKVDYRMTEKEKIEQRLTLEDGRLKTSTGKNFDTKSGTLTVEGDTWETGRADIVLDENDRLYFSLHPEQEYYHHSSLVAGSPVKFAGEIKVHDGIIVLIKNKSGHYLPSLEHSYALFEFLNEKKVDLSKTEFVFETDSIVEFLNRPQNKRTIDQFLKYNIPQIERQSSILTDIIGKATSPLPLKVQEAFMPLIERQAGHLITNTKSPEKYKLAFNEKNFRKIKKSAGCLHPILNAL